MRLRSGIHRYVKLIYDIDLLISVVLVFGQLFIIYDAVLYNILHSTGASSLLSILRIVNLTMCSFIIISSLNLLYQ